MGGHKRPLHTKYSKIFIFLSLVNDYEIQRITDCNYYSKMREDSVTFKEREKIIKENIKREDSRVHCKEGACHTCDIIFIDPQ